MPKGSIFRPYGDFKKVKDETMNKRIELYLLIFIVVCIVPKSTGEISQKNLRDFEIFQSIKMGSNNFVRTSLKVIVNLKDYDIDEMFDAVKSYQIRLNGESDELNIRLYRNKGNLFLSNPVAEKTFYKDSDE